jgi:hypothetical protein
MSEKLNTSASFVRRKEPPKPIGYGTGWAADKSEKREITEHGGSKIPNLRLSSP